MSESLRTFLPAHRGSQGIYSVCSSHPWVIEAAMQQASANHTPLLLEATSNQVNQDGGYTGMTPLLFRRFAHEIAGRVGFDTDRLILGGDHLGPNPWQHLEAEPALDRACRMVEQYAQAGFSKIHLDASMRCLNDPPTLTDELIATRAARLCAAAESASRPTAADPISYVIGTEVPVPGGAPHALSTVDVTSTQAAEHTVRVHRQAFTQAGLTHAFERVLALVVQPGVEFDHDHVIDYDPVKARHLQTFLNAHPNLVMEAHSTDYQLPGAYAELIHDGFAILKVGPALTFALREALFSLEAIEAELLPTGRSQLRETLERIMLRSPANWSRYYQGTPEVQARLRISSYSDRIRYYWGAPEVEASVNRLVDNLTHTGIPETLLSQHLPQHYLAVRRGDLPSTPKELALASIRLALAPYRAAARGLTVS